MTLVEFLLARIAEDEAVAREARLEVGTEGWVVSEYPYEGISISGGDRDDWEDEPAGATAHIERFSPARVLAECEAKRAILAFHESWPVLAQTEPVFDQDEGDLSSVSMRMSQQIAWLTTKEYIARFGEDPPTDPILRALALPYADHPDFMPGWLR